jgi:predicted nucleotidyltransferase component of viral defense system
MLHLSTVDIETYKVLKELFKIKFIKENFALAGGTALALQLGHRHSIDLDIFSPTKFNIKDLENILVSNSNITFESISSNNTMLFGYTNSIKTDFVFEPSRLLKPFLVLDEINYFHTDDIAAMKLHTVCGRGKRKDFFDIYVLLKNIGWKKLIALFEEKYSADQLFFLWRSIQYFTDADEDPEIIGFEPYNQDWNEVKSFLKSTCK